MSRMGSDRISSGGCGLDSSGARMLPTALNVWLHDRSEAGGELLNRMTKQDIDVHEKLRRIGINLFNG